MGNKVTIQGMSHIERAILLHNLICADPLNKDKWLIEEGRELNSLYGIHDYSGISATSFIEGLMLGIAYCAGAISGGKMREIIRIAAPSADSFTINKFAESAMNSQTLWEINK